MKRMMMAMMMAVVLIVAVDKAFSLDTSKCWQTQDPLGYDCYKLEILEYGEGPSGTWCPSIKTNPAYNWCKARITRTIFNECCTSGHTFEFGGHMYCQESWIYATGQMSACMNTCTDDDYGDHCKGKGIYYGECVSNTCYPQP